MWNELRFALYAIKKNIQNSAELRTSFVMNIVGIAVNNIAFIILWTFFIQSVGVVNGWTTTDIVGLQGFVALNLGIVYSIAAGIRKFPETVSNGSFDRILLSPKHLLIRVATSSFGVSAVGDVLFGIICLGIYGFLIQVSLLQILFMCLLVIAATIIFFAVVVIISSISFLLTDPVDVAMGLSDLFITPSIFHGGVFQGATRFVFTFLVPSLLIGSIPVEIVRDISFQKLLLICVLAPIWLCLAVWIFHRGVRKYESANFMTFG